MKPKTSGVEFKLILFDFHIKCETSASGKIWKVGFFLPNWAKPELFVEEQIKKQAKITKLKKTA